MTYRILQLFPELTDVNGDAQNALVLTRRLQWAGHETEQVTLAEGEDAPDFTPTVVVLGSGVDSALSRTRDALTHIRSSLEEWISSKVPLLAVGTGMELLGRSIPLAEPFDGLGILPGEATRLPKRVTADLVIETPSGQLVGYENHARGFALASPAEALGRVLAGTGNGRGTEGVRWESVYGTHLHGPVLARNPAFADAILASAGIEQTASSTATRVDAIAARLAQRAIRAAV